MNFTEWVCHNFSYPGEGIHALRISLTIPSNFTSCGPVNDVNINLAFFDILITISISYILLIASTCCDINKRSWIRFSWLIIQMMLLGIVAHVIFEIPTPVTILVIHYTGDITWIILFIIWLCLYYMRIIHRILQ